MSANGTKSAGSRRKQVSRDVDGATAEHGAAKEIKNKRQKVATKVKTEPADEIVDSDMSAASHSEDEKAVPRSKASRAKATASSSSSSAASRVNAARVRYLSDCTVPSTSDRCVVYWMIREQRLDDNWAIIHAQDIATSLKVPFVVAFCVPDSERAYSSKFGCVATARQMDFMLQGLAQLETRLRALQIPFYLVQSAEPMEVSILGLVKELGAAAVVTDQYPLKYFRDAQEKAAKELNKLDTPLIQVDAHNLVPVWLTSDKQEYAARTIRPKIHRYLNDFIEEFPSVLKQEDCKLPQTVNWDTVREQIKFDRTVKLPDWIKPGEASAREALSKFISERLKSFSSKRNDPTFTTASSDLSPFLNFGHLAAQRCVMEVNKFNKKHSESVASYIEELVVRRELSDNFCFYNKRYDSIDSATDWAKTTLQIHSSDPRDHLYHVGEFEFGVTHDDLWNASQLQLIQRGKLHGFLRMYWAKKILEWTDSPQTALDVALYLNDKYELDGRDPNGFVGCAWSVAGIHDTAWTERPVFGKIRFMNYAGCKRKFDVNKFVALYPGSKPGSEGFKANQAKAKAIQPAASATSGSSTTAVAPERKGKKK